MPDRDNPAPGTARAGRLVGALFCCQEGRKLLEDARAAGIDLGHPRPGASPLHLSSTALFMIDDVRDLCRQVRPNQSEIEAYHRAGLIGHQLIETARRDIWIENVARNRISPRPVSTIKPEFTS